MRIAIIKLFLFCFMFANMSGCAMQKDLRVTETDLNQKIVDQRYDVLEMKQGLKDRKAEFEKLISQAEQLQENQAELRALFGEMKDSMQNLQGRIEEATHSFDTTIQEEKEAVSLLDQAVSDMMKRLDNVESFLGTGTPGGSKKVGQTKNTEAAQPDAEGASETEEDLYASAKKLYDDGDYETSRQNFQTFFEQFPKSKNAGNAQFWLAETYYQQQWYEKAILEYQKVIEKYPKGNKVLGALLKQGFSFFNIGDKKNAKLILEDVIKKSPSSTEAKIAKKKLDGM
ncbi:MAG: tol-pal system protein YbgF [Pseudomonadota bacterium]